MGKRFLITGGAGFLGINLARYLLAEGHEVVSYDIEEFKYLDVKNKIKVVTGDVRDKELLRTAFEGVDIVIHGAAALPLYEAKDILTTTIDGTKNILDLSIEFSVQRMIFVSSTAVYGIPEHTPILETDKLYGVGAYGDAKIKAEEICVEYRKKGLVVPIIRPKSFIGPERLGVFALLYDWAQSGKNFPMIGSGNNKYQLLDVEDLCDAIYLVSIFSEEKSNDTFNIAAKQFETMKEDYQAVLNYAGHSKRIIGLPKKPVIWTLRILEKLNLSPLYAWVYETAGKDSFVSIDKAERIIGYKPKYSNKDALIRNYKWYIENKDNFKKASGVSHRVPWKQGILKVAKIFF